MKNHWKGEDGHIVVCLRILALGVVGLHNVLYRYLFLQIITLQFVSFTRRTPTYFSSSVLNYSLMCSVLLTNESYSRGEAVLSMSIVTCLFNLIIIQ